jgi:predicted transcriptional regulator
MEDMADDSSAQKVDPKLVAEIVSSYVAKNSIGVDQVGGLIARSEPNRGHCSTASRFTRAARWNARFATCTR